ncbi:MAG: ThiF family adenylyltransferase [Bacilli bacterium]
MIFQRLGINIGMDKVELLNKKTVLIIGIGGVGSYTCESLVRSGIGTLIIIDHDKINYTNINRQIIALHSTIGENKVDVMEQRILDINPHCCVIKFNNFFDSSLVNKVFTYNIDFVVDACDTIEAKYTIYEECLKKDIPFISAMGTGNKLDPTKFEISTLKNTSYDPLAKVLRKKVKDSNLNGIIPVVYSKEIPKKHDIIKLDGDINKERFLIGSNAFTPSVSGLLCTAFVINSLITGKYWL